LVKPPDYVLEHVSKRIAGEIILSDNPGLAIRKWREIYGLNQYELCRLMNVNPSVLSDYERGRRLPGRRFIKRFIEALFKHDSRNEWSVTIEVAKLLNIYVEGVIDLGEFKNPVQLSELVSIVEGIPLTTITHHRPIKGYTILDSVKSVQALTANEYVKALGSTSDRVVVFTNITRGRSVLVAVRVSPVKPSCIILHGVRKIDPLAIRIAILEEIPLIQSLISIDEIIGRFRRLTLV